MKSVPIPPDEMKFDNTVASMESNAFALPNTVCKKDYIVSIYYGISE